VIRLTLVLASIAFVAALALGFVYQTTAPKIEEQRKIADEVARQRALPRAACGVFVEVEKGGFAYYEGYANPDTTEMVGYAVKAEGAGYSSTIETIVGVDLYGRITGMKITSQQETPGLGTRIEEVRSTKTVLDALGEISGKAKPKMVTVDLADGNSVGRSVRVSVKDEALCGEVEKLIARGDTSGLVETAPAVFGLEAEDSAAVFSDGPLTFQLAEKTIAEIRARVMPWFQKQFIGKRQQNLILSVQETDRNIQAITGATISSSAVTVSVREAIQELEKALGGFKEVGP
jgi:electron transport complex protein RnfG